MRRILILCAALALLAFGLGTDGCDDTGGSATVDPDVVVLAAAMGATAAGDMMLVDPQTFDVAVVGLVLTAWGEATTTAAVPMKQAIEAGECKGTTGSFTINPAPYIGLPGTPTTPEDVDAAKEQVANALALALPATTGGLRTFAAMATASGDQTGCVVLTSIADFASPAGTLATEILKIVEAPGEPFTFPGMTWDCSACVAAE